MLYEVITEKPAKERILRSDLPFISMNGIQYTEDMAFEKNMNLDYQETETEKLDSQILGENLRRLQVIGLVGLPVNAILLAISAIRNGIAGLSAPVSILRICWIVATFGYFAASGFLRGVERPGKKHSFAFTLAAMLCCLFASGITVYNVSQDTATLVYIVVVLLIGAFLYLDSASFMIVVVRNNFV